MKTTDSANSIDLFKIEKRISEAFDFASRNEIAQKMGVNYQTLSNWLKGRTDFPSAELAKIAKLTDYSLNWILTGEGEKRTAKKSLPTLFRFDEDELISFIHGAVNAYLREHGISLEGLAKLDDDHIRDLARDEVAAAMPVQQLGTVDEFDIAAAVEKYDNAATVLELLYTWHHEAVREFNAVAFQGWNEMTFDQKVALIREIREGHQEEEEFEESARNAPKKLKHS